MTNEIKSYLICATPRSGSSLLCEALRNSGLAGNPDEYFGPMHVKRWNEHWQTQSEIEYLVGARQFKRQADDLTDEWVKRYLTTFINIE